MEFDMQCMHHYAIICNEVFSISLLYWKLVQLLGKLHVTGGFELIDTPVVDYVPYTL